MDETGLRARIENLPPEFEAVRDADEEIRWVGRPVFLPYVLAGVPFLVFGLAWGAFDYFIFIRNMGRMTQSSPFPFGLFFTFHLAPCYLSILNMVRLVLVCGNTCYAITNKRLMIRSGFFGTSFESIDYDRIMDLQVTVNPVERMLHLGTIRAFSGRVNSRGVNVPQKFSAIRDPYVVFKQIKEISVNVKTDWNYPNASRPGENPGYRTREPDGQ